MMLYILRHATAEETSSSGDDGARQLTQKSKEKMVGAAAGFREMELRFINHRTELERFLTR